MPNHTSHVRMCPRASRRRGSGSLVRQARPIWLVLAWLVALATSAGPAGAAPPAWASKLGREGIGGNTTLSSDNGVSCRRIPSLLDEFLCQVSWIDQDSVSGTTVHQLMSQGLDRAGGLAEPPAVIWTSPTLPAGARGRVVVSDDGAAAGGLLAAVLARDPSDDTTDVAVLDGPQDTEARFPWEGGIKSGPDLVPIPSQIGPRWLLGVDSTEDPQGNATDSIVGVLIERDGEGELVFGAPRRINDHAGGNVGGLGLAVSRAFYFFLTEPGLGPAATEPDPEPRVVAVWDSFGSPGDDGSLSSIQARLLDDTGVPLAMQFQVNTYTPSFQLAPDVAAAADGSGFLVVWQSDGSPGADASLTSIQARAFDWTGSALGDQLQINQAATGFQYQPAVAALDDGRYLVVWTDDPITATPRVTGRLVAADGQPLDDEFAVSLSAASSEADPDVATIGNEAVVVWAGADGSTRVRSTLGFVFRDDFESADLSSWTVRGQP